MSGFDNLAINHNLELSLVAREADRVAGEFTHDISKNHYPFELHGAPTWSTLASGLPVLNFVPGNPDWLDCSGATTANLNFTTEDFSIVAWVCPSDLTANRSVFCRGLLDTDGYYLQVLMDGNIAFFTNQAAADQVTYSIDDTVVINQWCLIGISRVSTVVTLYKNGVECAYEAQVAHTDPLTSARETHIGVYDNEVGSPWSCYMWNPRAWGSRGLVKYDHQYLFNTERHWFGV